MRDHRVYQDLDQFPSCIEVIISALLTRRTDFVKGNVYGMYLGGYGNFVSTTDTIGVTLTKHLSLNAGYQLGSRLVVDNNSSKRIGLRLTQ